MSTRVADACDDCLRRSWLLADLGPFIQVACDDRPGRRTPELLALGDEELVRAVAPSRIDPILSANRSLSRALMDRELVEARNWATCRHGDLYPSGLLAGRDGPAALLGMGDAALVAELSPENSVTVVGSRRPTSLGSSSARRIGRRLVDAGLAVVSGMALGIDGAVHEGAISSSGTGRTVAVLGSGADHPYPGRHRTLHRAIVEHGAVISEMPPGSRPWRWSFPARNRIMAALTGMTVVVEARFGSGSLITAELAVVSGRDVGAVPGPVTSPLSEGCHSLIREGALLVRDAEDVVEALAFPGAGMDGTPVIVPAGPDLAVLEAVGSGSDSIDALAEVTGMPAGDLFAAVTRLEMDGHIEVSPSGEMTRISSGR